MGLFSYRPKDLPKSSDEVWSQANDRNTPLGAHIGYGSPTLMWMQNANKRGEKEGLTTQEQMMANVTGGLTFQKSFERLRARQDAAEKAKDAAARQQAIDEQLALIDANYGVGDQPGAEANRGIIGGILDKNQQDFQGNQNEQLQGMFSQALSQNRFNLADRGLAGSGVDQDVTRGTVGTYLGGRQQVAQNAGMYRTALEGGLNQQRLALRDQVMKGTTLSPDTLREIGDANFAVGQARTGIPAQTIGNIFSQAGGAYGQGQIADANRQNNGGSSSLWPSSQSNPYKKPGVGVGSSGGSSAGTYTY